MSGNKVGIKFYILIFYNFYYNSHVLLTGCLLITFIKVKNTTYKKDIRHEHILFTLNVFVHIMKIYTQYVIYTCMFYIIEF